MIRNSLYMYLVLWLLNMKCIFDAPKYFFYTFGNKDLKIWTLNSKRHCLWISPPSWSEYKPEKNQRLVKIQRTDQPFSPVPEPDIFPPLCSIIHFFSKSAACWPNPKCRDTALTRYLPPFPHPRVRLRCPRLRSALTFSPGTIARPGHTFYRERLAGKGNDRSSRSSHGEAS